MVDIVGITAWTWDSIPHSRSFKPMEYSVLYFSSMIAGGMKSKTEQDGI